MSIKNLLNRFTTSVIAVFAVPVFALVPVASAAHTPAFQLEPFEFVCTVATCGVDGTDTVTGEWVDGTGNPAPAILLQKLGATSNPASAGVDITSSLIGGPVSAITELNFEYKVGDHCGGGAPRFNIQSGIKTAFLGCNGGTQTPIVGTDWVHVEFSQAQITAALTTAGIAATDSLDALYILFDEGEDVQDVGTAGTVYIDNISVNNQVVGSPTSPRTKDDCKKGGWKNFGIFKNQGDCVSYVSTSGRNGPSGIQVASF